MKGEDRQLEVLIRSEVKDYVKNSRKNWLGSDFSEPAWAEPLIGIVSATDPLFTFYKEDIGPFYWKPEEIFHLTFPNRTVSVEELSIVSWILPQTEETKRDQRREKRLPAKRWMCSRSYGQDFNDHLSQYLVRWCRNRGIDAVSPSVSSHFERTESSKYGFASYWSERHTAFAAGLGIFGLCDGLITPLGKAVRFGSIILKAVLHQNRRAYSHPNQYCLFFQNGNCGECINRCPAGAISKMGHDKTRCNEYIQSKVLYYGLRTLGRESTGCGLCQSGVPCESTIPKLVN